MIVPPLLLQSSPHAYSWNLLTGWLQGRPPAIATRFVDPFMTMCSRPANRFCALQPSDGVTSRAGQWPRRVACRFRVANSSSKLPTGCLMPCARRPIVALQNAAGSNRWSPSFAPLIAKYGYAATFVGTLLEGETFLVLSGLAAHRGYLGMLQLIAVGAAGAFLTDNFFFAIGRALGPALLKRFPSLAPSAARAHALVERLPNTAVISVRFLYGMRSVGPAVIGSGTMRWSRFILLDALAACPVERLLGQRRVRAWRGGGAGAARVHLRWRVAVRPAQWRPVTRGKHAVSAPPQAARRRRGGPARMASPASLTRSRKLIS